MITETGRVVAIEERGLWVETIRKTTCGSCEVQKGCGHGVLNKLGSNRSNYIWVLNDDQSQPFSVDDEVEIGIPEHIVLTASFIVYMIPLILLLLGAVIGESLLQSGFGETIAGMVGAVGGFTAGLCIVAWHNVKIRNNYSYQPRLVGPAASSISVVKIS